MSFLDKTFQENLELILTKGYKKEDRTGTGTISFPGVMIRHDMSDGYPLLTLRKVPFKSAAIELEGFIKGITSKQWYKERGCNYWNQWCNPQEVAYGTDNDTKKKMEECDDLGEIYGKQWRDFHDVTYPWGGEHIDQLKDVVDTLKSNPNSRRMLCSAWNPLALEHMALPPCHFAWQVNVTDGKLNLFYYMRSVDFVLGNDLNTYGLLLHLLAKESNLKEGMLVGFFADAHIYLNHIDGIKELLNRNPTGNLPTIKTDNFKSIYDWQYSDTILLDYNPLPSVKFNVAV
jgi:thymidylate synthase